VVGQVASAFFLAFRAVWRNKLRASLTVLGILIGVLAVVLVAALGAGARASVTQSIASIGSNVLFAFPQAANASGARGAQGSGGRLTEEDGRAVVRESTSIRAFAPVSFAKVQVVAEGRNVSTSVVGTTRPYFELRAWHIAKGAPWEESSENTKERVCVLGNTVKESLFGDQDAVGRIIRVGNYPFRVVGVLGSKGQSTFGSDQDDVIAMPIDTFRSRVSGSMSPSVGALLFSATSAETSDRAVKQATEILRQRHHIGEGREPDFAIRSQAEFQAFQQGIFGALSALLLSVAAVSLIVGGIGVMNIMLVSVAERTREIGIRMAIGARAANIRVQFLIEAVVLSLIGGVAGVALSFLASVIVERSVGFQMLIDPTAVAIAFGTSTAIGLVFGFFPAHRAANLDPIQALRRE
jgi:putative ABC transport system permease protein